MIVPMHKAWQFKIALRPLPIEYQIQVEKDLEVRFYNVEKCQAVQAFLNEDELSGSNVRLVKHIIGTTQDKTLADNYRVTHYERIFIPGCIPAGSNVGMLGVLLAEKHREPVDVWLQRLRNETNQSRQARNKPLLDMVV